MKNRFIAAILTAVLLIQSAIAVSAAHAGEKTLDEKLYNEAGNALKSLGVISEYDDLNIGIENMTRFEFVKLIVDLFETAGVAFGSADGTFSDVDYSTELAKTVDKAIAAGLIYGDGDSKFRADDIITRNEAVSVALNALGYNAIKSYMTYPQYLAVADRLDLTDGVYAADGLMSLGDAYVLIYNMLTTDILEADSFTVKNGNTDVSYEKSGKSFLRAYFNAEYAEGIMTANQYAHISRDEQAKDYCYILSDDGEVKINCDNSTVDSYLGYAVKAYYRTVNSKNYLLFMWADDTNDVTVIDGEDVTGYDFASKSIKYYERRRISELESVRSTKETSEYIPVGANVVYNSYYVDDNRDVFERINAAADGSGELSIRSITLLDNNNDGKTDIMFVNMYENCFVEKITQDGLAMDYWTKKTVDLQDDDRIVNIYDESGNKVDYTYVKINDVLAVERDGKNEKLVTVYVTRKSTKTKLAGVSDDDGGSFELDGETISLPNGTGGKQMYAQCRIGDTYEFYFDISGKVAGMKVSEESAYYAYALDDAQSGGIDGAKMLKVCVPDESEYGQTVHKYNIAKKLKIDDVYTNSSDYDFSALKYKLLRIKLNSDDEISSIQTPSATKGSGVFSYMNPKEESGAVKALYRPNWTMFIEDSSTVDDKKSANFAVNDDTIILAVPSGDDVEDGEEKIARIENTSDYFVDWKSYNVHGYALDEKDMTCRVLLVMVDKDMSEAEKQSLDRRRVFVVDKVTRGLNAQGFSSVMISGMEKKNRVSYTSSGANMIDYDTKKAVTLNKGDIIQTVLDVRGDVQYIRRIYNAATDSYGTFAYRTATYSSPRVVIGRPFATNGNYFSMTEKNRPYTEEYAEVFCCGGDHFVYVYDREAGKVKLGSWKDITADDGARIVAWASTQTYLDVVIYK